MILNDILTMIKTEMRVIPALISFIMLIIFLLPLSSGIINLGNCAGALISGVLIAVFLFYGKFSLFISHLWETSLGRIILCTSGFIIFAVVCSALVMSCFMLREIHDVPHDADTTVIVLGCKVKNGAPSLMLKRRLDAACIYLKENPDVFVVVSGGQGNDECVSEARCMCEYLVSQGIDINRIFEENQSTTTDENLRFSYNLIVSKGLPEHITIVTDGFHQLRSDMKARKLGLEAYNISAHTPWWLVPTYWVREWFGIAFYTIKDIFS